MVDTTQTTTEKKLTQSDIRGVFLRSNLFQGSWNFERMQALGFCFSMVPAIRRLYPENNEARKQAIRRHLEFFNTQPFVAAPILGVTLALEEQRANGAEIDDGAINGIKVGLMGPLAGVGDPIFWGTVRPVFAALGAGIAMSGSLLGPLLFFILFNLVRLATRYYGVAYGYSKGIEYGLNTFSQARPYAHQSLCLHERENHHGLLFMYACLLGAMMCFMDTPVRTLS